MYRYLEMIQHTIDVRPSRVPLAEIYESGEKQHIAAPIPQLSNKILAIPPRMRVANVLVLEERVRL